MLLVTRLMLSILSILLSTQFVRASDASQPATAATIASVAEESPKAALKAYNAAMRAGDVAGMVGMNYATNDDERRVARACAQSDLEVGRLIAAARDRFGDDAAKRVSEAINDEGDADIDAGTETINGNHGGVTFVGGDEPSPLIKVNGQWKVDVGAMIKQFSGPPDQLADSVIERGSAAKVTRQELVAGQYPSVDALVDALKSRLKDQ